MCRIRLARDELEMASIVGVQRQLNAIERNLKPRFPERYPGELFAYHILGAQAELAVAKVLNLHWGGHKNRFESGDLPGIEVRWSRDRRLKVRERDTGKLVGVAGYPPEFEIGGYIWAERAKQLVNPTTPRPGPAAYFVPFEQLGSIEELALARGERGAA